MKYKLTVKFDGNFIISRQSDPVLPQDRIKYSAKDIFKNSADIISASSEFTSVTIALDSSFNEEKLQLIIDDYISNKYNISSDELSTYYTVTIEDFSHNEDSSDSDSPQNFDAKQELDEIFSLAGWQDFKLVAQEIAAIAPQIRDHGTSKIFASRNYLISAERGYGITTVLTKFCNLITSLNIFPLSQLVPVEYRLSISDTLVGFTPAQLIAELESHKAERAIICIDVSEFSSKDKCIEFKSLLLDLNRYRESFIFFFRVPFFEPDMLKDIFDTISDVMFVKKIIVPPLSADELVYCAKKFCLDFGYSINDDVEEVFINRVSEEKSDGRFYGVSSVLKIVCEMIFLKQNYNIINQIDNTEIFANEVESLSHHYTDNQKNPLEELSSMVGMESVLERVKEIIAQIKVAMSNKNIDKPCVHMQFLGNPGTGKTTVARIVGRIMAREGILRNGYFFEHSARELCGQYVGQTAPKTFAACRDAYGSVLFIDEAYSLFTGDDSKDYGTEALTTLIAEMENHRSDMLVILAGYTKEMETLMQGNAGLKSRIPFLIEFKNYTKQQLFDIFMKMCKDKFKVDDAFEAVAKDYFMNMSDTFINDKEFSNARFVRNLFERTWSKAAIRFSFSQSDNQNDMILCAEDFKSASVEKEFVQVASSSKNKVGFRQ